jgi:hypothetical protein
MPAPTSFNDWDTNGTHTTPVLSGHTTDGFVNNEIPGSAELNQWMMLTGQWTRYLNSLVDFRWYRIPPTAQSASDRNAVSIGFLPAGAIVRSIGLKISDATLTTSTINLATELTVIASFSVTPTATGTEYLFDLTSDFTIDSRGFTLLWDPSAGGSPVFSWFTIQAHV